MTRPKIACPPHELESGTFLAAERTLLSSLTPEGRSALSKPSQEVDPRAPWLDDLTRALVRAMRREGALGLSAPQLGEPVRVLAVEVRALVVLCNPRVVRRAGNAVAREACASVPFMSARVARAAEVVVIGAEPLTGREVCLVASGYEGRAIQHEIDHLDGFLFTERTLESTERGP